MATPTAGTAAVTARVDALIRTGRLDDARTELDQAILIYPRVRALRDLHRRVLDGYLERLVASGTAGWGGGHPGLPARRAHLSPGPPLSDWIIENRR